MNDYLIKKDKELKSKAFNDESIDDILLGYSNLKNDIEKILYRYQSEKNKTFILTEQEYNILENELIYDYHLLIKSILNYLITFSEHPDKSNLRNCCIEYIKIFFENIKIINCGLPENNMIKIVKWTINKMPRFKKEISKLLFDKIINGDQSIVEYLSLTNSFIIDNELKDIFGVVQYFDIYDKYLLDYTDEVNINLYLDSYKLYYDFLLKKTKNPQKERFKKKYCDFVINNIDFINISTKHVLLNNIRDIMNDLNYSDKDYFIIDKSLEEANHKMLEKLQTQTFWFPKSVTYQIKQFQKEQNEIFFKVNNQDKIVKLLFELTPISISEIKKYIDDNKNQFASMCQKYLLDVDGKVINYKNLKDYEIFSLNAREYIYIITELYYELFIKIFFNNYSNDLISENFIKKICSSNKLISQDRVEIIVDSFISFFKQNFKESVYDIILELEESLRYYFKSLKMNVYKKNRSNDLIDLSTIFNNNTVNQYKDKLLEIIDEDFYFTLKWFLVDNYGFQLRHKIAHRYKSNELYNHKCSIYISIMIFKLYFGFHF